MKAKRQKIVNGNLIQEAGGITYLNGEEVHGSFEENVKDLTPVKHYWGYAMPGPTLND